MTAAHASEPDQGVAPVPDGPPATLPADRGEGRDAGLATFAAMHVEATRALDAAGVPWCRLRPAGDGHEDDLLVGRGASRVIVPALAGSGFAPVPRLGRGSHRSFHAVDPVTGRWAKVDVVTRIDLGPYQEVRTTLADGFIARRRPSDAGADGGSTLRPDDAFWALLLHELWDRPAPALRRMAALQGLAQGASGDDPAAEHIGRLFPPGVTPERVVGWARAGDAEALLSFGRAMRRRPGAAALARRAVARLLRRLDRHDPPFVRRGLSVALLGPDGTGKSTLSATVAADAPIRVRSVYLGLYGGERGRADRRRLPGVGFARRLLRMWRGWLAGRLHVARGRIVVFDRHPYDARLPTGGGRPSLGRRSLGRSVPAPDLTLVLDAPPEVLYARKPEHPVDRLAVQRAGYLALAERIPRAVVVDVDRPSASVERAATAIIWAGLVQRARGR